jgi:hypothetical protein
MYLGTITETRDHATHPVRVSVDLGDGALDLGWVMVSLSAWACVRFKDIKAGVQCTVWDTKYAASPDKYRVLEFWPVGGLTLENNQSRLARQGQPVRVRGSVKLTAIALGVAPTNPLGAPLPHDLVGVIQDDG